MSVEFLPGNHLCLLETGAQYFPALLEAIAAAERTIQLETYIFANDATGRAFTVALAAAARRGVTVRVLVDGFGARGFKESLGREIIAAGGAVEIYRPERSLLRLKRHRLRRLHRKLAVIDGRIAFVGGINIIDDADTPGLGPRFDYAVSIEGSLVTSICASMLHLWRLVGWARIRRRPPRPAPEECPSATSAGNMTAAYVVRDNLRHRRDIEEAYLAALCSARHDVLIANAYFLPGRRFRHALIDAVRRGCRVTVVLQGRVEYVLLHYATQALYGQLLKNGVRIFEYRSGFLHAKVAAVDDDWATVGSSNIDPFSLLLAREANVIVQDARFTAALRASLGRAITEDAVEITSADLRRSGWLTRALRWLAYGLVRLMLGVTRYGGEDYRE